MADAAAGFKALADENRMLLLRLLLLRSCCVRGLARQLGISPAGVSQHLKVLREAGLVLGEKAGYHTHYTVDREALRALARELTALAEAPKSQPCSPRYGGCPAAEFAKCRSAGGAPAPSPQPMPWKGSKDMKIAVTYENGQVFQHFGHCQAFQFFTVEEGKVTSSQVVSVAGSGHGALAGFLKAHGADTLICGGIGGGARTALAQAGIQLYPGVTGSTEQAVQALLDGTLLFNPDTLCSHHHGEGHTCGGHGEGHGCGSHGCGGHDCGEDKHGCPGNH